MLIPQFSIRWLLGLTAVCAVVSLIVARGIAGSGWAIGTTIALGAIAAIILVHLLMFFTIWLLSLVIAVESPRKVKRPPKTGNTA